MELDKKRLAKITITVETDELTLSYEMQSEDWGMEVKEKHPYGDILHSMPTLSRIPIDYEVVFSAKHLLPLDDEVGSKIRAWYKNVDTEEKTQ